MPLRLTITSYHKLTPGQCSEKVLDQGQLTIGRGPDNDWVLPDPERLVSSRHCTILNRDGVYYLTDTSTNGVLLVNAGQGDVMAELDEDVVFAEADGLAVLQRLAVAAAQA
ncbi:TPA: FHA domain-containing protein, partial [Pseudomonas aeruginosa]